MISRFQNSVCWKDDGYQPLLFVSSGPDKGKSEPFPVGGKSNRKGGGGNNGQKGGNGKIIVKMDPPLHLQLPSVQIDHS